MRVQLRVPTRRDQREFLRLARTSRRFLQPWGRAPSTPARYQEYLGRVCGPSHAGFLVCRRGSGEIVGVINLLEIIRGAYQGAFLGYYAFAPLAGRGYMREGLVLAIRKAFRDLHLHRLEANIQPRNTRSKRLVRSLGFRREGFSPRYLKIGGRWRDHERWALLAEEWRSPAHRRSS